MQRVLCSRLRSSSSFKQGPDLEIKYLWKHLNNSPRKHSPLKHIIAAFRKIVGCVLVLACMCVCVSAQNNNQCNCRDLHQSDVSADDTQFISHDCQNVLAVVDLM